ncbi:hypothetical protein VZT92_004668 [Zoarces viviparus]|uniref:Saposin B-type domain-containing protein n=1 Tax=Zoarces viviparus TaxID=48416 RepID=A0AAW1FXG7_ZOAVI
MTARHCNVSHNSAERPRVRCQLTVACSHRQVTNMASWIIQMTVMVLSVFTSSSQGKRDKEIYCSACKAIVDELNYSISQVDPKKTVNVGGFRLNPDGTMKDKKVPLARSETHLSELLDGVCNSMSDYASMWTPIQRLKFACESVVEELEDDIISLFSQDTEHVHQELCNTVSDYCKDSRHTNQEL